MLVDAAHSEETRVVVINGNRLEEFDFETSTKKQIKGNIYLAKITRVEPSLQAAFVDFGGNRHGFLAFSEIHPDYYRIPVSDREEEEDRGSRRPRRAERSREARVSTEPEDVQELPHFEADETSGLEVPHEFEPAYEHEEAEPASTHFEAPGHPAEAIGHPAEAPTAEAPAEPVADESESPHLSAWESEPIGIAPPDAQAGAGAVPEGEFPVLPTAPGEGGASTEARHGEAEPPPHAETVETLGVDSEIEDERRERARRFRHYKIQEVIKRRQIMLVQVTKEERGNKGAALTTYLSLAGRYCVLMPNTPRGGGVSRKITSAQDRRRLKDLVEDLDVPDGMGVIVRTAGSERTKPEIKRDFDYLIRLWDEIRDHTLQSTAPALIYEEGNLIKRSIRDLYQRDIEEVLVEGEEGYRTAKAFMKMLMPSHAKRVQPYRDPVIPLFQRFQIESQLDAIHSPTVQLRSGGYIVINQTEALVAIDVNSGRSTRERNIEETALRTNLEAADEVARQLRLRDLAGLIVIDFIDMEEHRNQIAVERRLKEAMKHDRARIQIGRISAFGLLELSRQRLRPSITEASTQPCPHCSGTGFIRSTESTALHVLRAIEEEGVRRRSAEIAVTVPTNVALYILNQKRDALLQVEARYRCQVRIDADEELIPPAFRLERLRAFTPAELAAIPTQMAQLPAPEPEEDEFEEAESDAEEAATEGAAEMRGEGGGEGDADRRGRRRRRRRRGRRDDERMPAGAPSEVAAVAEAVAVGGTESGEEAEEEDEDGEAAAGEGEAVPSAGVGEGEHRRRRRGRRGGRRRRREGEEAEAIPARASDEHESPHPAATEIEIVEMPPPVPPEQPIEEAFGETPLDTHAEQPAPEFAPEGGAALPTGEAVAASETAEPSVAATAEPSVPGEESLARTDLPEAKVLTERPANPRRGWWSRG
jgi:ribonuclease E